MGFTIPPRDVPVAVTSLLFTTIAFVLVAARLYTRAFMLQSAGADDYIMTAAMAASIGFCVVVFYQIKYGLGIPISTIPLHNLELFFQCLWATIPMYNLSLVLTKISIVCQYMRIFTAPRINKFCKIMIGVLICYGCWTVLGSVFMCIPVPSFWNQSLAGHCMNKLAFWFSNAALNITTDIMIFAIPMPLLRQLQLPRRQKIGLMFVFGFGAFVCVTSVIRLKSLYEISISTDTSLDGVNAAIWSGIEINVAIACASLPALKPLISRFLPHLLSTTDSKNKYSMNNLSSNKLGSRQTNTFHEVGSKNANKNAEITVEQHIFQQREVRASMEGSERSLVNWKADCFSEDSTQKKREIV